MTVSCATSPDFSKRPVRAIERGFTQPAGVRSWRTLFGVAADSDPGPFLYPAQWEHGITDWFTLIWMPLPLEARFRLFENEEWSLAAGAAFLGYLQSRNRNFDWRPATQVSLRKRFNRWFALDTLALGTLEITRDPYGNPGLLGGVRVGPWFQIVDRFGLGLGIQGQVETGAIRSVYVGQVPAGNTGLESQQNGVRFRAPLTFSLLWAPFDQWELQTDAWIYRLGYPDGFTSASLFLAVVHSW